MWTAEKILSPNDLGLTGTHQAGMLVPKRREILRVFPRLDESTMNPTAIFDAVDPNGKWWSLAFKHYNNALFTKGTRNEYRVTRLTRLLHEADLRVGDRIRFTRDSTVWRVSWERTNLVVRERTALDLTDGGWVAIKL